MKVISDLPYYSFMRVARRWRAVSVLALFAISPLLVGGSCKTTEEDPTSGSPDPACKAQIVSIAPGVVEPGARVTVTFDVPVEVVPDAGGAITYSSSDGLTFEIRVPPQEGSYGFRYAVPGCDPKSGFVDVRRAKPDAGSDVSSDSSSDAGACGGPADDLLAAGTDNGCARACGCTYCWGRNNEGQLGVGLTGEKSRPVAASMFATATSLSMRNETTCFVSGGETSCVGILWDPAPPTAPQRSATPKKYSAGAGAVVAAATSGNHTCATTSSGRLLCWGNDSNGAVGDGYQEMGPYERAPYELFTGSSMTSISDVAVGAHHTCAVSGAKNVLCWGETTAGNVLGVASGGDPKVAHAPSTVLMDVSGSAGSTPLTNAIAVATGRYHSCALRADASVVCWGSDGKGQLGDGAAGMNAFKVVTVSGLDDAIQIAAGAEHTCALRGSKTVVCWGSDEFGQLGDGSSGTTAFATAPVPVKGLTNVSRIAVGWQHSCAQLGDGSVYCWGLNSAAGLGQGTHTTAEPNPLLVIPGCR